MMMRGCLQLSLNRMEGVQPSHTAAQASETIALYAVLAVTKRRLSGWVGGSTVCVSWPKNTFTCQGGFGAAHLCIVTQSPSRNRYLPESVVWLSNYIVCVCVCGPCVECKQKAIHEYRDGRKHSCAHF